MDSVQLELHYHLRGQSHSMDALVRNKAEAEALAAFLQVAERLGVSLQLESSAYQEGGLREVWRFIGASKDQLGWILAIIVLLFSRYPVADPEANALNKEVLRLTVEEKKANLEKLKTDLKKGPPSPDAASAAAQALEGDLKIATRRSNFYRGLSAYEDVTAVGFTALPLGRGEPHPERTVPRSDFARFMQHTDRLPIEVIDEAAIEIVAPVLREGSYQWKGVYLGQPISFGMLDEQFKTSVSMGEVSFQRGSTINAVLHVHRKFDEVGDVTITGYSVVTVLSKAEGSTVHETAQGRRHRFGKKQAQGQRSLFQAQP